MGDVTISALSREDVLQAHLIEKESLTEAWSIGQIESFLENDGVYLCAKENNSPIGIGSMYIIAEEGQIMNIAVSCNKRGMGVGKKILLALMSEGIKRGVKSFVIEVDIKNTVAFSLYENLGFAITGTRKTADGVGFAYVMEYRVKKKEDNCLGNEGVNQ